jgi:MFS family permease
MVSCYFLSNGIVGFYVGWIPDYFGRKTTVLYALGTTLFF